MDRSELLSHVDHTLLRPDATWGEIRQLCDEALKYHTASVCVPPSYVTRCANYLRGRIPVCTVVGFPNGYNTTKITAFEAAEAVQNGADEIDMVINLEPWNDNTVYDRLGLDQMQTEVLGVKLPSITIPVKPGRNLASIVEVAAMNNRNRKMGHNAALELTQRMDRHFEQNSMSEEPDEED